MSDILSQENACKLRDLESENKELRSLLRTAAIEWRSLIDHMVNYKVSGTGKMALEFIKRIDTYLSSHSEGKE